MASSILELKSIRSKTRVTRLVSRAPLRLLETGLHDPGVEIQLASYGGGILQGDHTSLEISCGDRTGLLFKSQGNTHVYKNEIQSPAVQITTGRCGAHASVQLLPEPVVLHAGAKLIQQQHWNLTESTDFVLCDWMQSGRSESKEQFAFDFFQSQITLSIDGTPILEENLRCRPALDDIRSPAAFGPFDLMLTVYLLGPMADRRADALRPFLQFNPVHPDTLPATSDRPAPAMRAALTPLPKGGYIVRALARTRRHLQPLINQLETSRPQPPRV